MLGYLISLFVSGLIIGALGRLAIPGPNPMGVLATVGVGLLGSFIGGAVAVILFGSHFESHAVGVIVLEVLGAALVVWIIERIRHQQRA